MFKMAFKENTLVKIKDFSSYLRITGKISIDSQPRSKRPSNQISNVRSLLEFVPPGQTDNQTFKYCADMMFVLIKA